MSLLTVIYFSRQHWLRWMNTDIFMSAWYGIFSGCEGWCQHYMPALFISWRLFIGSIYYESSYLALKMLEADIVMPPLILPPVFRVYIDDTSLILFSLLRRFSPMPNTGERYFQHYIAFCRLIIWLSLIIYCSETSTVIAAIIAGNGRNGYHQRDYYHTMPPLKLPPRRQPATILSRLFSTRDCLLPPMRFH